MRKILLLIALIFTSILSAQRIGADVIKFSGKVTTTVRDGLSVPSGETWLIYNVTTGQFEKGNDSEVWEPFTGPGGGDVISVNGKVGEVVLNPDDLSDASSSNKFVTASLLAKLESIETGAQVNVQSDWNAASGDARILNKPALGELAQKDNIASSDILGEGINGQVLTTNGAGEVTWQNKGASSFGELLGVPADNTALASVLNAKQNLLVSGSNIKTVNGNSLLGAGNVAIETISSFADLEGDPYDNSNLASALDAKANDSEVVKTGINSQLQNLKLSIGDSTWIADHTFGPNDIVINTDGSNVPGGDNYVTDGSLSGAGVLNLNMNYGSPIQIPGFNSGGGGGSVSWGGIGGTIGDQTDLMGRFDQYLLNTTDTFTGNLTVTNQINAGSNVVATGNLYGSVAVLNGGGGNASRIYGTGTGIANIAYQSFYESDGTTRQGYIGFLSPSNSNMVISSDAGANQIHLNQSGGANGLQYYYAGSAKTVWHSGNDGNGSGLDADTLDGINSTGFATASHTHNASDINTGTLNIARIPTGTTSATVKIGNWVPSWDEITNKSSVMLKSENLSGLSNYATARANLSLGSLALLNVVSGSQIMDGSITTAKIVDNQITNAKAADMAANTLKGRLTSSGDPQDLTVSQARDLLGIPITSGTFSPTLDDGNENGSFTYTVEFAKYFRIGGNVVLNIHISGINGTGSGGGLEIYGIPTTIGQANPGYYYNPINSIVYGSTNYNNGDIGFFINGDIIQSYETDDLGVPINVSFTDGEIFINATYLANY